MISILIPAYNQNIIRLVTDLQQQAVESTVDFEIIVMEDGSEKWVKENELIGEMQNCRHFIIENNIGRSAVRNKLADEAKYKHFLFIDGDAEIASPNFINRYLTFCKEDCVVIGGTSYDSNETNPNYSLRLKYGRERESRNADKRKKSNFATFNFLISKCIFNRIRFDDSIRGYGYEDMLFGHQLHQLGYKIIQIENPLIHKGLDDNETFIRKTEEGARNLFLLYQTGCYPYLAEESNLLNVYIRIYKLGLTRLFALKFDVTKHLLRWLLCQKSPSLLIYDWYKLLFLCKTSLAK
jgi:glycosyltransferase involved in cell wall biosynthesis